MSRIGNRKIVIPEGVSVELNDRVVKVTGKLGELERELPSDIEFTKNDNEITLTRKNELKATKALHGTCNANITNMIKGVTEGYKKELEIIGVGYRFNLKGNDLVINAVEAHHGDVEPKTLEAVLVQAADAISASRPGARRETLEAYIKRLQNLEEIANSFEGVEKSFAIQAGREVRIIVKPEKVSDNDMTVLARNIAKKVESDMEYPGQIKVNLIRESRAIEYAK